MTQEDKELLLKDLCARLPYGVKVLNMAEGVNKVCELDSVLTSRKHKAQIFVSLTLPDDSVMTGIEMVKPYLFPMSSMTKKEKEEYHELCYQYYGVYFDSVRSIDWLNKKMFDHHTDDEGKTMIEKGLALEASKEMYD